MNAISRREFLKVFGLGSFGAAAALALAACAKDPEETAEAGADYVSEAAAATANQDTSVVEQEIVQAETLAEKVTVQINALDDYNPWDSGFGDGVGGAIKYEIYQSLADRNGFGTEMINVMMDSYEKLSPTTYRITLRDGIHDHNGNPFTADDYIYTLDGMKERGEINLSRKIADYKKIDDLTVEISFTEDAIFNTFDMVVTQIRMVTRASMEASIDAMATTPVGTGPYKVTNYVPGSGMTLELDEDYWMPEELRKANVTIANVKTIQCDVLTESAAIAVALQTKHVDISEAVNTQDLPSFREGGQYSDGIGVYSTPTTSTSVLVLNSREGRPLADKNLRKACLWAIDTDLICDSINGGNNAKSYVMGGPTYSDYQEAFEQFYPGFDLNTAKEALAESGYPNGCELDLIIIGSGGANQDIGVIMQAELEQLGIKLNINGLPFGQFRAREDEGDWDFLIANLSSTGGLVNVWTNYFSQTLNGGHAKNGVVDDHLEELVSTVMKEEGYTPENMLALWEYIETNYWVYGLYLPMRNYVFNSNLISGMAFNMMDSLVPGACVFNA